MLGSWFSARLAEYLGSPAMSLAQRSPLEPLFELAAVQQTAVQFRGKAPLGEIAENPKLQQSLLLTFREFERLSPEGIEAISKFDSLRGQMVVWYRLVKEVTRDYYTREDLCHEAASTVRGNAAASSLRDLGFLVFYLIPEFSPAEEDLIRALDRAGAAAFVFPATRDPVVDEPIQRLLVRIEPDLQSRNAASAVVDYRIEHVLIAHNYQEEVKWVVRKALSMAELGMPFSRMAILYPDAFPYAEFIEQQLAHAGVPASGPSKLLLRDTPAGRLVTGLLEVIQSGISRDALMKWVAESPVRAAPGNTRGGNELARWEVISQSAGIVRGADNWRRGLANFADGLKRRISAQDVSEEDADATTSGLKEELSSSKVLLELVDLLAELNVPPDGSSYKAFGNWMQTSMKDFAWDPDGWPEDGRNALGRIEEILKEMSGLDRLLSGGTSLKGFADLVGIQLETSVGRIGRTGEGIFVAPVTAAVGMSFDSVFIVGMSEGAFPRRPAIDALLPDSVRLSLPSPDSLPLSSEVALKERRGYLAALAAGKTRFLTFCWTDPSAERGQYPSPWLMDEIAKLNDQAVGSADVDRLANKPWLSKVYSAEHAIGAEGFCPADIHDYDMASLFLWKARHHGTRDHFLLADSTQAGRALSMEDARRSSTFSVWDGNLASIGKKSVHLKLPGNDHFSPTRLESWAVCPMRYFFGYALQIPVYEKPEEILIISALERGSLVHRILERFISTLIARKELPEYGEAWTKAQESMLLDIARQEFATTEKLGITGRPLMWQMAQEEIEQDLVTFLDEDAGLRAANGLKTIHVERSFGFGGEGSLPPVLFKYGSREIRLHGLIDRVDSNESGDQVFVIDYKTGSAYPYNGMKKNPLDKGKHLQLPVYSLAVRGSLYKPANIKACYWFISSKGDFERREVELSAIEKEFIADLEIITEGIEEGVYPANPGEQEKENCTYCYYDRICAADRDLMWKRKAAAPELKSYLKLISGTPDEEEST